jgi:4-hydroxy-3-methylbut-2-enyl diphosphate reductase
VSEVFDLDTMFDKIGLANQTTMYKKETRAIGQLLQKAMMKAHGPVNVAPHYMEFDTICDATQVRSVRYFVVATLAEFCPCISSSYLLHV